MKGADGIHAEWEYHSPVLRIIGKGPASGNVSPCIQYQQQRDPPCCYRPEKERKPHGEWEESLQKGGPRDVRDEHGSGKRGYGSRTHIDPVRSAKVFRGKLKEHEAIEYESDNENIEHATHEKHRERKEQDQLTMAGEVINKHAAQDRNGLGAHGGYQPDSVDTASKRWFFRADRKNGEYGINQNHPENETEHKEENGHPGIVVKFDKLAPHNACCCYYSQISDSTAVIAHIREETVGKKMMRPVVSNSKQIKKRIFSQKRGIAMASNPMQWDALETMPVAIARAK